jgi:hypothetical protein
VHIPELSSQDLNDDKGIVGDPVDNDEVTLRPVLPIYLWLRKSNNMCGYIQYFFIFYSNNLAIYKDMEDVNISS